MRGRNNGAGTKSVHIPSEFAAFEELTPRVRRWLNYCTGKYSSENVLYGLRTYGEEAILDMLWKADQRDLAAWRAENEALAASDLMRRVFKR